jgi:ATP-dependent exoDNAse (exonuclease V) alpha subunit
MMQLQLDRTRDKPRSLTEHAKGPIDHKAALACRPSRMARFSAAEADWACSMAKALPDQQRSREALSGLVERVTFHSAETGFSVLRVKVRGHRDLITVLGSAAEVHAGESIQASGQWQQHREHGLQFRATFLEVVPPSSIEGIRRYLGSGMIKGIGPHFAGRLVSAFGENVFDVIERTPARLLEVDGIGKTRLNRITAGWSEQKAIREIMVFLQSHGVGTSRSVRIYKTYGADAVPLGEPLSASTGHSWYRLQDRR